ncbi:MAG TPA: hypothetical protein VFQ00_06200 [Terriglobales bacterium]|nr:hypothetical protein [Terriglobales bacterium]
MNRLFRILLITTVSVLSFGADPAQPFSLTVSARKPQIKAGSEVWITIRMTNTSDHDIDCSTYYVSGTDLRFHYIVRDSHGNSAKKKIAHPELVPGSTQLCTLKPGESVTRESRISWVHDLSQPDKYAIQVSRAASGNEQDQIVQSNVATITVIPQ